jgi:FMN phosphatase YigB (HAD superfamily)
LPKTAGEPVIRALIFDLDNCLADAREAGVELYKPAFDAIRQENRGAVAQDALDRAFEDIWRHSLDWVADHYGFSREMTEAGWRVFSGLEVNQKLHGYGDLSVLSELPANRFLVTSGFRRLQESKIRALELVPQFNAVYIDAIDERDRLGKLGHFEGILLKERLTAAEVLVIGDNADSEIAAGARLGMPTVQTLRHGVPYTSNATFHIHSLQELKELLSRLNADP